MKLLVERGADIDAKSQSYPIVSEYAIGGGFEYVYWLLEHGANPDNDNERKSTINAIFWHSGNPDDRTWQRKCQQWMLKRGYKRPPLGRNYRSMRQDLGFPHEERKIPLLSNRRRTDDYDHTRRV